MVVEQIIHKLFENSGNSFGIVIDDTIIKNYSINSLNSFYNSNIPLKNITRLSILVKENKNFSYYEINLDNQSISTCLGVFDSYVRVDYTIPDISDLTIKDTLSLAAVTLLCVNDTVLPTDIKEEVCINMETESVISCPIVLTKKECDTFLGKYYIVIPEPNKQYPQMISKMIVAKKHLFPLSQAISELIEF